MIKIFLESDKFSHIAGVTLHATNVLARKSHNKMMWLSSFNCLTDGANGHLYDTTCMHYISRQKKKYLYIFKNKD